MDEKEKLFALHMSEDGDVSFQEIKDFDKWMKDGPTEFASALQPGYDLNWLGGKYLLIKGRIVTPKPVQVVTKYEI